MKNRSLTTPDAEIRQVQLPTQKEDQTMSIANSLIARAQSREITFGIVGLGYVGLPLAIELSRAGFRVMGYDVSPRVVEGLNAGRSHLTSSPA